MEDEVPTLGGTVTHAELRELKESVDYLALGHIHKRYEAGGWIYNPGSPEGHSTREGRDGWEHGYYSIEPSSAESGDEGGTGDFEVSHHETNRRPYYRVEFDVTPYDSPGGVETAFREEIDDEVEAVQEYCQQSKYTAEDKPRQPIIDLRFTGTLQFSRGDFRSDELAAYAEEACDALYVQENAGGIRTADVQQLISEIDEEEVFKNGQLNTVALEDQVFETIAKESVYAEQADDVANVLVNAHEMAQAEEAVGDIRDAVGTARRDLFPELADSVVVDIDKYPFEEDESPKVSEEATETEGSVDDTDTSEVTTQ
jgi:DNA repair exonuclease SbcCD nuclease subunit